jgi:hypothetical protein
MIFFCFFFFYYKVIILLDMFILKFASSSLILPNKANILSNLILTLLREFITKIKLKTVIKIEITIKTALFLR